MKCAFCGKDDPKHTCSEALYDENQPNTYSDPDANPCEAEGGCDAEGCQTCCAHGEWDHDQCMDCGKERCPGQAIDRAEMYFGGDR